MPDFAKPRALEIIGGMIYDVYENIQAVDGDLHVLRRMGRDFSHLLLSGGTSGETMATERGTTTDFKPPSRTAIPMALFCCPPISFEIIESV